MFEKKARFGGSFCLYAQRIDAARSASTPSSRTEMTKQRSERIEIKDRPGASQRFPIRAMSAGRIAAIIAAIEALFLLHRWMLDERVVLSVPDDTRMLVAQVVARREFPYISSRAYLVILDAEQGRSKQQTFLMARDVLQDIVTEVRSIRWEGSVVHLDIDSPNGSAPKEFAFQD